MRQVLFALRTKLGQKITCLFFPTNKYLVVFWFLCLFVCFFQHNLTTLSC